MKEQMKVGDSFDIKLALKNTYYLIKIKNNKIVKISGDANKLMPKAGPNSGCHIVSKTCTHIVSETCTMGWTY